MDQSIEHFSKNLEQQRHKIDELSDIIHSLDKSLALFEQNSHTIVGHYKHINTEIIKINEVYTYLSQQLDNVKTDINEIKIKVADLTNRQSRDEKDKERQRAFFKSIWKNKAFILSIFIFVGGLYEGGRALYYADSPNAKIKVETKK